MTAMRLTTPVVGLFALLAAVPAMAGPDIPEPQVRLVAAGGGLVDGRYRAVLDVTLGAGWHTYWRNPGDSGIAPRLDTAGSGNLDGLVPSFPAPTRYFDGYGTTLVYWDRLLLPLTITPADPARPVDLALAVDFGYCKEICVPGHADLAVTFDPAAPADPAAAALIDTALDAVPVPEASAGPEAPRLVSVTRTDPGAVTITVESAGEVDLFAEPPEGWYLAVPTLASRDGTRSVFTLSLDGAPAGAAIAGAPVRFTAVGRNGAIEALRRLD